MRRAEVPTWVLKANGQRNLALAVGLPYLVSLVAAGLARGDGNAFLYILAPLVFPALLAIGTKFLTLNGRSRIRRGVVPPVVVARIGPSRASREIRRINKVSDAAPIPGVLRLVDSKVIWKPVFKDFKPEGFEIVRQRDSISQLKYIRVGGSLIAERGFLEIRFKDGEKLEFIVLDYPKRFGESGLLGRPLT